MELEAIVSQAKAQIDAASDAATLDQVRVEFMGKKGKLTDLLKGLGYIDKEISLAENLRQHLSWEISGIN